MLFGTFIFSEGYLDLDLNEGHERLRLIIGGNLKFKGDKEDEYFSEE
jgi:hypothetical protein